MPPFLATAVLSLTLFTVTFAVNLQAPLYGAYAADSGVGATAVTVAFAAYVAGLMPTLLLLGGLSDRIGRRMPLAAALLLGFGATALLAAAPSFSSLVAARVLLGIGTALATSAGAAYMTEIMGEARSRTAALVVTSATSLGFGGGALATGVSLGVQGQTFVPANFLSLFAIVPVLVVAALLLPRAVSLLRLPVFPTETWVFGAAMLLAWSATGMTIAVVPLELTARGLGGWTGLIIFLAIFVGFLSQPLARRMTNARSLALGMMLVPGGFLVLLLGVWTQTLAPILLGTAITSSASYGFSYLAALAEVGDRAPTERARATAGLFVWAYAGFSIPVIGSGIVADALGMEAALIAFGGVLLTASGAIMALWMRRGRTVGAVFA